MGPRPTNNSKPRDDSFTQDVLARGLDAFKDRRNAQSHDRATYQQAFNLLASGGPYQPYRQSPQYDSWRQQQGFTPVNYPVTFGRTEDGPYAGFKTQGMLQAAIQGQGEYLREQDRLQAQALAELAASQLQGIEDQYASRQQVYDPTATARMQHMPSPGSGGDMEKASLSRANDMNARAQVVGTNDREAKDRYNEQLARWAASAADPYFEATDFAQNVENTPLRDYATKAAAMYGVDPMIARGWYDEASQLGDYRDQRDLQSIEDFGAPYSDYQQAYNRMLTENDRAANDQADAQDQELLAQIGAITGGYDPQALASGAKMDVPTLVSVVTSPAYAEAMSVLDQQTDSDGINTVLEQVLAQDPELYRVLAAQFNWKADAFDNYGG